MEFVIHRGRTEGHGTLFSDCVPRMDGQKFAVLITGHGLVYGESRPKCEIAGPAETGFYMVRDSFVYRTTISGKAYTPSGMKKLAVQFADRCISLGVEINE